MRLADHIRLGAARTADSIAPTSRDGVPRGNSSTKSAARAYVVREGDSFYSIARAQLGDAGRWSELLELNKSLVNGDPTNLRIDQTITLPAK